MKEQIADAVKRGDIKWQKHAFERMLERGISRGEVKQVLEEGEVIEEYSEDRPFPSGLFLGYVNDQPLHVVAAIDPETARCYVITAYRPDKDHFQSDYKTRK